MAGVELTNTEFHNVWIGSGLYSSSSSSSSQSSSSSSQSSSSQSSSSKSSSSSSSQSSSSQSSSSSSSSETPAGPYGGALFFDMLATEEELKLTYEEFVEKRVNKFYEDNPSIFDDKTNEEKEDIILNMIGEGEMFTDVAIAIVAREGLEVE
jgi:hypothetical protein